MKFSVCYIIRIALVLIAIALALWVKDVRKDEFAPDLLDTIEEEVADTGGNYILPRSNGGLFTVPYEQKIQQSPSFGFISDEHFRHS